MGSVSSDQDQDQASRDRERRGSAPLIYRRASA
jgi:hypothetical protein